MPKEAEFTTIVDELIAEDITVIDEFVKEEIQPLIDYQLSIEKKIGYKAIEEMYELEEEA